MREETRVHVRNVMADSGYVLNRSAADMRGSNAGLVGLVINDLRNPFFTEFASSLQMAMTESACAGRRHLLPSFRVNACQAKSSAISSRVFPYLKCIVVLRPKRYRKLAKTSAFGMPDTASPALC